MQHQVPTTPISNHMCSIAEWPTLLGLTLGRVFSFFLVSRSMLHFIA